MWTKYFINRFLNIFETFKFLDLLHFHSLLKPMLFFMNASVSKAFSLKPACSINHPAGTLPQFLRRHSISFQEIADVFFEISF
jgi:hypothetical protein